MATYRFYLAPRLGTGTRQDPLRSKLANYIVNDGTKDFWNLVNRSTPWCLCLAWCDSALHATIEADAEIRALSPELADVDALNSYMDGLQGTIPAGIVTGLENAGVPVDWVNASTTRREVWRYISRWHYMSQQMTDQERTFLANNLNTTFQQLAAAARTRIQAWMTARAIATAWITNQTQVRAIITFIVNNGNFPAQPYGPLTF